MKASSSTSNSKRTICFVTGSRAEFGLMESTLRAIERHPRLNLRLIATGMHLSARQGRTVRELAGQGWRIDRVVGWPGSATTPTTAAVGTGRAIARLAEAYEALAADLVLVVGDRVEAFAAAAAGSIAQRVVAHVHGGDRATGQVDDSLRHAITKLSHLHFAATDDSARRIERLGEDAWRIHRVGAPGIDGIARLATPHSTLARRFGHLSPDRYAILVLHPVAGRDAVDGRHARIVLGAVRSAPFEHVLVVYPNNDPGADGIADAWDAQQARREPGLSFHRNLARGDYLGLLRDAATLVGNSSSGIIEAASFGTPVINIGPRQDGRQRSGNVIDVTYDPAAIARVLRSTWNGGAPRRFAGPNVYGGRLGTGRRIAAVLARVRLDDPRLLRKRISY